MPDAGVERVTGCGKNPLGDDQRVTVHMMPLHSNGETVTSVKSIPCETVTSS